MIACSTPTVDGDEIDSSQGASTGKRGTKDKKAKTAKATEDDDDDDDTAGGSSGTPATTTTATPTTTPTETTPAATTTAPAPTTTATTPPPVVQPNCRNDANPLACLDCCLDSNPDAVSFENSYDDCLANAQSQAEADNCLAQHVSSCNGSAACQANHACMEANNCLASNSDSN